ncbi:3-dehydroquinate synthase [Patescibacteria group bacterium]
MKKITVPLKKRIDYSYAISYSTDYISELVADIKNNKWGKRYAVISDSKVKKLYGEKLVKKLKRSGINAELLSFPFGEKNKTLDQAEKLIHQLSKLEFHRDDCVIALGGGVTGDLAGFVASIYMRGIPYIQIPTTLLSMVDSSVGGKTGVDSSWGKNLIGTFYQPKKVYIDTVFLKTLPKKQLRNGIAEVIKYGVIKAPSILRALYKKHEKVMGLDERILKRIIMRCIKIKADIVGKDERETGIRKILNYGHTVGHAIEKISKFKVQHGEGVSLGMAVINTIATDKKMFAKKKQLYIKNIFKLYNLPTKFPKPIDPNRLINIMKQDKKAKKGKNYFIVPQKLGKVFLSGKITNRDIIKACKKHS